MIIGEIYRYALQSPGKAALIHNGQTWSYAALAQAIELARVRLAPLQFHAGGYAVLAMQNLADAWIYGIALRSQGVNTVPLPASRDLADLRLDAVEGVIASSRKADAIYAAQAASRGWKHCTLPEAQPPQVEPAPPPLPPDAPQGGHMVMSSGTTGLYKMVLRDAVMESSSMANSLRVVGISEASVTYVGDFPLLTIGGWRWPLMTLSVGGTVVFHQGEGRLRSLLGGAVNLAFSTPATLAVLLHEEGHWPRRDSMRLIVTGGPLPQVLWQRATERLTHQVCTMLGSTEMLSIAVTPVESVDDLRWYRIHPSREVQVVDEADRVLQAGTVGVLRARQPDALREYLGDPEATQEFYRGDYFYPGDLAAYGPDGRLALHGRVTDVINALGTKIATGPIEQSLADRHGVEGVCVFAAPNAAGEDEVHIVLQATGTLDQAQLKITAQELLSMFRGVHFHQVAQLPRNHMGKIQRLVLRRQILEKK